MAMRSIVLVVVMAAAAAGAVACSRASPTNAGARPPAPEPHAHHAEPASTPPPDGARASQPFRDAHVGLLREIEETERAAVALAHTPPEQAAERVQAVVGFFRDRLAPHAAAEEAVLYSVADRVVGAPAPYRYTDGLRHDHRVVETEIGRLTAFAASGDRTAEGLATFWPRAIALLGAVGMHFAAEEDVVLDLLDRRMTPEQFHREVMEPTHSFEAEHGGGHEHH